MSELENENTEDDRKIALRYEIIKSLTGAADEKDESYAKVGKYYYCSAPSSLYKYYSDKTRNLDNIKKNKMWFSAPCNFNDVFDCDISIDERKIFEYIVKNNPSGIEIRNGSPMWKKLKAVVHKELNSIRTAIEKSRDITGVSCFSENEDSLLMWAHYANNHRGFCVEYDLLKINEILKFAPIPVIYSNDRVSLISLSIEKNTEKIEKDVSALLIKALTSKSSEWNYENEWRIVRDNAACGDRWDYEKNGALLDMITPSSIILGCEIQPDFERDFKEFCKNSQISLFKMEKDATQYKLNKKPILEFND